MAFTDDLRRAIVDCGQTHYRIGKEAGIAPHVLDRFVSGERPHLRTDTVDKLCDYFELELCTKKKRKPKRRGGYVRRQKAPPR